jgi:3-deoxy-D-manno-octulosonic-acid transferase
MSPPLSLGLYRLATGALEPFAPALLRRRAARGKEDPARLGERLGRAGLPRPAGPLVWLHGASVGEGLSLLPLVEGLRAARPDLGLLVTSGTVTSAELLARRLPAGVAHQYAPVDAPGAAARFLDHWRPAAAVLVESELWPNLVLAAKTRGVRLALVSARLSKASLAGWGRAPGAARALLSAFDLVMAQDETTARGLAALGAPDDGRLNLKLAGAPLPVDEAALAAARAALGARPLVLAASTHPGEEAAALHAFAPLRDRACLVVVPRHPDRGPEVAALAEARGFAVARQGDGAPFEAQAVYVADRLGELGLWLRLAATALVGGSLVPGIGGHNPLEAARLGAPAIAGPFVDNWREVYADLGDAIVRTDAAGVAAAFAADLADPAAARARAERARGLAETGAAAVGDAIARVLRLLP